MSAHLGDALSALLDGELAGEELTAARLHLAECGRCRLELEGVRTVRRSVRALPPVLPPPGFLERLTGGTGAGASVSRLWDRRWTAVNVAASAAAAVALVVLGVGGGQPASAAPRIDAAVADHGSALSMLSQAGVPGLGSSGVVPADPGAAVRREVSPVDVAAPFHAPLRLGTDYRLVGAFEAGDGIQLVYVGGRGGLSVFQQRGHIDWSALPAEGRRIIADGLVGWQGTASGEEVLVIERNGVVHTLVSRRSVPAAMRVARSLPEPRSLSLGQRLRQACQGALDDLSVVG